VARAVILKKGNLDDTVGVSGTVASGTVTTVTSTVTTSKVISVNVKVGDTVKKGETVSGIAARSGLRNFGTLLSVNAIDNARQVSEGQMLRIPSVDGLLYTVKKDETLTGIAAAYNMSVTSLLDANDLTESTLMVGQQLFIPGASLSSFELRKALGELFIYPIRGRLTSPFGYRQGPFTGIKSLNFCTTNCFIFKFYTRYVTNFHQF